MLRVVVVLLLAANVAFLAWTRGWLAPWAEPPAHGERDPDRLAAQVRPEAISVLSARAASAAVTAARAASIAAGDGEQCVETGPYAGAAELSAAEAQLAQAGVDGTLWTRVERERPAVWAVVLGPYDSPEAQRTRAEELRRQNIVGEPLKAPPALAGALLLGRYESQAAAEAALPQWNERGARNARAAAVAASAAERWLRFERSTPALRGQLRTMKIGPAEAGPVVCPAR